MNVLRVLLLVAAVSVSGCRPAAFDAHRGEYERLALLRLQQPDDPLWFTSTAPSEARALMLRLGVEAVIVERDAGWVLMRQGGGYMAEHGYVYALERADTTALYQQYERLQPLGDGWHAY